MAELEDYVLLALGQARFNEVPDDRRVLYALDEAVKTFDLDPETARSWFLFYFGLDPLDFDQAPGLYCDTICNVLISTFTHLAVSTADERPKEVSIVEHEAQYTRIARLHFGTRYIVFKAAKRLGFHLSSEIEEELILQSYYQSWAQARLIRSVLPKLSPKTQKQLYSFV